MVQELDAGLIEGPPSKRINAPMHLFTSKTYLGKATTFLPPWKTKASGIR
jgi:hypothetical protein